MRCPSAPNASTTLIQEKTPSGHQPLGALQSFFFWDKHMTGSVRVINKSHGPKALREGEVAVAVDRTNRDLGNPYVLRDKKDRELRDVVCNQFERMAEHDMVHRGPIYRAVMALAERVANGEKIALQCWCKPDRCHADWIADRVRSEARQLQAVGSV